MNNPAAQSQREYYLRNHSKYIRVNREYQRKHAARTIERRRCARLDIIVMLGGKCSRCGYKDDLRALQIDHVFGRQGPRPRRRDGRPKHETMAYIWPLTGTGQYQLLCANCNMIKADEEGAYRGRPKI